MTALAFHERKFIKNTNVFYNAIDKFFAYESDSYDARARIEDEEYDAVHANFHSLTEFMSTVLAQHYAIEILEIEYADAMNTTVMRYFVVLRELTEACFGFASPDKDLTLREAVYRYETRAEALSLVSEFCDYVQSALSAQND